MGVLALCVALSEGPNMVQDDTAGVGLATGARRTQGCLGELMVQSYRMRIREALVGHGVTRLTTGICISRELA